MQGGGGGGFVEALPTLGKIWPSVTDLVVERCEAFGSRARAEAVVLAYSYAC